ncbi:hypothetical protein Celaphus_00009712 [Cervus elaphus hippelaphus]|uniref:Uncharacterized protein n=1 Tax=Cervus elaphus hippelaphus TaxID=46360 RepID=A0A212C0P1_CEREH|nr:hypothetical protein Celaphus_00009712 [Cervus elaphus hippelaphus]
MMTEIVCTENPVNQQSGFLLQLVDSVTNSNSIEHMKELTLDAICYICQDIHTEQLQGPSSEILTAIILGKLTEDPNSKANLMTTKPLLRTNQELWLLIPGYGCEDFCLARFCKLLHEAALSDVYWVPLLQCLREGLSANHHGIKFEDVYETSVSDDQEETATYC